MTALSVERIERKALNERLIAWDHKHGPLNRPIFRQPIDYGVFVDGEIVGVVAADTLIRETCKFDRSTAFEASRVCAERRGLCPLVLRMWREFAYPEIVRDWSTGWVISYQDFTRHTGGLYRYDGWQIVGYSTGGADPRAVAGTVTARKRIIWGWHSDAAERAARRDVEPIAPRWAA